MRVMSPTGGGFWAMRVPVSSWGRGFRVVAGFLGVWGWWWGWICVWSVGCVE